MRLEKSSTDGYLILFLGYARSSFRDFGSFLRIFVGLDEENFQLFLKQCNSYFITSEISPAIYSIKDFSEVVYTLGDHDGTLQFAFDDISMKAKLILTRFVLTRGTFRFGEKSFSNTILGFTTSWDYRPTNADSPDSPGVYTSEKNMNLSTIDEIR